MRMMKMIEYNNFNSINMEIDKIINKYENISLDNVKEENEIKDILRHIQLDFEVIPYIPEFILTTTLLYNSEKNNNMFARGEFIIRPSVNYTLSIKKLNKSFTIINDEDFIKVFVNEVADWLKSYSCYIILEKNIIELNSEINKLLKEIEYPYDISFTLGDGIMDIDDNSIVLGLNLETILNIHKLGLFSEDDYWREKYIEKLLLVLKECNRPYDIVKVKSDITNELCIYQRKSIHKLLRKIVKRNIDFVRVGIGYVETDDLFAIIEKIPITKEESKKYRGKDCIIIDNDEPIKIEVKKNQTKIVIKYKLMPFEKKTNVLIDVPIKEFLVKWE